MTVINWVNTRPAGACKRAAEASDLQFDPGFWPARLPVEPGFGNDMPLCAVHVSRNRDNDVVSVLYQQYASTMQLEVFND